MVPLESTNNSLHISTMETFTDILLHLKLFVKLIYQIEMSQEIKNPWSYQTVQHSFSATNKTNKVMVCKKWWILHLLWLVVCKHRCDFNSNQLLSDHLQIVFSMHPNSRAQKFLLNIKCPHYFTVYLSGFQWAYPYSYFFQWNGTKLFQDVFPSFLV